MTENPRNYEILGEGGGVCTDPLSPCLDTHVDASPCSGLGAEIVEVQGDYDDAVAEVKKVAAEKGWTIVGDTAWLVSIAL